MPNEDNKILKYSHGEKLLKAPFIIPADLECLLKKYILVKVILKNLIQRKKLSTHLLVIQYSQVFRSMKQKINIIVSEKKNLWKSFRKT